LILDGVNFRLLGFNCEDTHWVGTLAGAVVGRPGLFFHWLAPKIRLDVVKQARERLSATNGTLSTLNLESNGNDGCKESN
jgi:hypothetical protein